MISAANDHKIMFVTVWTAIVSLDSTFDRSGWREMRREREMRWREMRRERERWDEIRERWDEKRERGERWEQKMCVPQGCYAKSCRHGSQLRLLLTFFGCTFGCTLIARTLRDAHFDKRKRYKAWKYNFDTTYFPGVQPMVKRGRKTTKTYMLTSLLLSYDFW